jgi:hypothetical protein
MISRRSFLVSVAASVATGSLVVASGSAFFPIEAKKLRVYRNKQLAFEANIGGCEMAPGYLDFTGLFGIKLNNRDQMDLVMRQLSELFTAIAPEVGVEVTVLAGSNYLRSFKRAEEPPELFLLSAKQSGDLRLRLPFC